MPSYFAPTLIENSTFVTLEGEEFHHLSRVKRLGIGDSIKLNSGGGILAVGEISQMEKAKAVINICSVEKHPQRLPRFAIAFAMLKNHHDELAIEKCTELGASAFIPMQTEFSVRAAGKNTLSRYEKIALAAIKQCDNPWLPTIYPILPLQKLQQQILAAGFQPILCSEKEQSQWWKSADLDGDVCFLIGPEGGFSAAEFDMLQSVPSIKISDNICRAETAAIAIAAQFVSLRAIS